MTPKAVILWIGLLDRDDNVWQRGETCTAPVNRTAEGFTFIGLYSVFVGNLGDKSRLSAAAERYSTHLTSQGGVCGGAGAGPRVSRIWRGARRAAFGPRNRTAMKARATSSLSAVSRCLLKKYFSSFTFILFSLYVFNIYNAVFKIYQKFIRGLIPLP